MGLDYLILYHLGKKTPKLANIQGGTPYPFLCFAVRILSAVNPKSYKKSKKKTIPGSAPG